MAEQIPLLFDTDIGSDIDDAVALAYLLNQPRCELLGITTVTGYPQERAKLADAVCRAAGRSGVPTYSGTEPPLLVPLRQTEAPQKSILPNWPHDDHFPPNTAVPFLQRTIRSRPGEITLLAVGPFTNIALLFAIDPEIPSLLKQLVVMGGVFSGRVPNSPRHEWNALGDPHATARMYQSAPPGMVSYGLDVTMRCTLSAEECRRRFRGGALDVVAAMAEVWYSHGAPHIVFHDPLAAVGIFHPEVCDYTTGRVEVEIASPRYGGMTTFTADPDGPHQVALDVRPEQFFERYFELF